MKRKRGHKKGKNKKLKSESPATVDESTNNDDESVNTEDNSGSGSGSEDEENNKFEVESNVAPPPVKVVEAPPPPLPKVYQRPTPTAVYGRVKLKLKKTPKPLSLVESPSTQIQSDAVNNTSVADSKVEEGSRKSGAIIKIVSSKSSSPPDKDTSVADSSVADSKVEEGSKKSVAIIKIASSKSSSSLDKDTSVADSKMEEGSKKSGGTIKIVSSKGFSPSDKKSGKESSGNIVLKNSSSPSSDGKEGGNIVLLKSSSPPASAPCDIESGNVVCSSPTVSGGNIVLSKSSSPLLLDAVESGMIASSKSSPALGGIGDGKESGKIVYLGSVGSGNIVSSKALSGKESGFSQEEEGEEEEKTKEQEGKLSQPESRYNKEELEASLEVIQKVMKLDNAEPFNVPVDPIALGIPDYFDVIHTPMDFGTIRTNLEIGAKYKNSEDVYKDVLYIWDNCCKYNNKGDYIVDLMKRVRKNFMKYWVAAGLYTEQTKMTRGEENSPLDEPATSGQGKKLKKGKGVKRHKDDCLCAICIMKRRRREREAREAQLALKDGSQAAAPQIKVFKTGLPLEYKQEEISHAESPIETSSYMETSHDGDADAEMEDGETRHDAVGHQYNTEQKSEIYRADIRDISDRSGDISEKSVQSDKGDAELYSYNEPNVQEYQDESGSRFKTKQLLQPEGHTPGYLQRRNELLEMEKQRQKLRMLETFRDLENPKLLGLCGTLFPNNVQTVWNGANSLTRCQRSCRRTDIYEAVASFVNPRKSVASLK